MGGDKVMVFDLHNALKDDEIKQLQDRIKQLEFEKKGLQGLIDGQAVVIKELEDKLEQVKFALEVESHDNNYNKDRYKAIAQEMAEALKLIRDAGQEITEVIAEKALAKWEEMRE